MESPKINNKLNFNDGDGKNIFERSVEEVTKMGDYYRKYILEKWVYPFIEQGKYLNVVDLGCGAGAYLNQKIADYIKNQNIKKLFLVDNAENMCDLVARKTENMNIVRNCEVWNGNIASWFIPIGYGSDMQRVYTPLEKLKIQSRVDVHNASANYLEIDFPNQGGSFKKVTCNQQVDLITMFGLVHYLNPNEVFRLFHNILYMLKPGTGRAIFSIPHPVLHPEIDWTFSANSLDWGWIKVTEPQTIVEKNRIVGASFLDMGIDNVSLIYKMEHRTKSGIMQQPFFYHNLKLYYLMCQYLGLEITMNHIDLVDSSRCNDINGKSFGYPTTISLEIKSNNLNFSDKTGYDLHSFRMFSFWLHENYKTYSPNYVTSQDMERIDFNGKDGWNRERWRNFCFSKLEKNKLQFQLFDESNSYEDFIIKTYQEFVMEYGSEEFKKRLYDIL